MQWRHGTPLAERQHRNDLARLAAALYPAEHRIERAPLIADPRWMPDEPIDLRSVALDLDEGPQDAEVDGTEPESAETRPLRIAGAALRALHLRGQVP